MTIDYFVYASTMYSQLGQHKESSMIAFKVINGSLLALRAYEEALIGLLAEHSNMRISLWDFRSMPSVPQSSLQFGDKICVIILPWIQHSLRKAITLCICGIHCPAYHLGIFKWNEQKSVCSTTRRCTQSVCCRASCNYDMTIPSFCTYNTISTVSLLPENLPHTSSSFHTMRRPVSMTFTCECRDWILQLQRVNLSAIGNCSLLLRAICNPKTKILQFGRRLEFPFERYAHAGPRQCAEWILSGGPSIERDISPKVAL